jgi:hypothetical protein
VVPVDVVANDSVKTLESKQLPMHGETARLPLDALTANGIPVSICMPPPLIEPFVYVGINDSVRTDGAAASEQGDTCSILTGHQAHSLVSDPGQLVLRRGHFVGANYTLNPCTRSAACDR